MDIVDFLTARLDEDERRIKAADSDGEFRATWVTFRRHDESMDYTTIAADHRNGYWVADGTAYQSDSRTIISEPFFDARHTLADVAAKRRVVELHSPTDVGWGPDVIGCANCDASLPETWGPDCIPKGETLYPCGTVRLLALPYAGHPDYDEAWSQ